MNYNLPNYFRTDSLSWRTSYTALQSPSPDTSYNWPLFTTRESFFMEETVRESVFMDVMETEMILMNMMKDEKIIMEQNSYYEVRRRQRGSIRVRPLEELLGTGRGEEGPVPARRKENRWYELPEEEAGNRKKRKREGRKQVKVRRCQVYHEKVDNKYQSPVYKAKGRMRRLLPKRPVENEPQLSLEESKDTSVMNTPPTLLHLSKTDISRLMTFKISDSRLRAAPTVLSL